MYYKTNSQMGFASQMLQQMADELELELETEENINKTQERITKLSSKVRDTAAERDTERSAREAAEAKATSLEVEKNFYQGFNAMTSKYAAAAEHTEDIKAKVVAGYSVEDATVAVLAANGKFGGTTAPVVQVAPPMPAAGGSAAIAIPDGGSKPIGQWTQIERRAKLVELQDAGDISLS